MKYGIRIKIDVTKIDKSLLFEGKKGKYLDATVFMDPDHQSEYGDNGMITQDTPKDSNQKGNILGNVKVFWTGESNRNGPPARQETPAAPASGFDDDLGDLPF